MDRLSASVRAADGSVTQSGFSRRWSGNAWTTTDNAIDAPSNALVSQFVKSRNGTLLNASPANPARNVGTGTCKKAVFNSLLELTRIINFHNDDNANATWSYGTTADSDIDMGYAAYNSSTWYVSGSYHVAQIRRGVRRIRHPSISIMATPAPPSCTLTPSSKAIRTTPAPLGHLQQLPGLSLCR